MKVFDRTPNLQGAQIISYRVSPDSKWSVLIGITAGAPERCATWRRAEIQQISSAWRCDVGPAEETDARYDIHERMVFAVLHSIQACPRQGLHAALLFRAAEEPATRGTCSGFRNCQGGPCERVMQAPCIEPSLF